MSLFKCSPTAVLTCDPMYIEQKKSYFIPDSIMVITAIVLVIFGSLCVAGVISGGVGLGSALLAMGGFGLISLAILSCISCCCSTTTRVGMKLVE